MTGWTWDYARNNMTFKRYEAMKKYWREMPPLPVTAFVLARAFGMETTTSPDAAQQGAASGDIFYDESFYENTAATPWREGAGGALKEDFQAAGGEVKR